MDNYRNSLKVLLFSAFVLLFSFAPAHAQQGPGSDDRFQESEDIIQSIFDADVVFEGENKDLAHSYFAQLFGEFIFVNWGVGDKNDVTLLSRVLGFTNILALILGIVIVYYVIVGGAVNTAQAGEVLGKSWSSVWLPLRVSAGFGSIMPANLGDGNPFSVAQIFILWLIMIGSNGATVLWNSAVDALINGSSPSITHKTVPQTDGLEMFNILMCTEQQLEFWGRDKDKPQQVAIITGSNPGSALFSKNYIVTEGTGYNHSIKDIDFSQITNRSEFISEIKFARGCGSITLPDAGTVFDFDSMSQDLRGGGWTSSLSVASDYKVKAQWLAVQSSYPVLATTLNETRDLVIQARQLMGESETTFKSKLTKKDEGALESTKAIGLELNTIAHKYSSTLTDQISKTVDKTLSEDKGLLSRMKQGGWVVAGKWFYEIGAAADLKNSVVKLLSGTASYQAPELCETGDDGWWSWTSGGDEGCKENIQDYTDTQSLLREFNRVAMEHAKSSGQKLEMAESVMNICTEEECGNDEAIADRLSTSMAGTFLNMLSDGDVKATDGSVSPFTTLSSMGHTMNNIGIASWFIGMGVYTISEGIQAANEGSRTKGLFAALYAPMNYMVGTLVPVMASMLTLGFTLAYVIPFLPIMTWIIMIIGYLVTTIEAVVASPLAVILMVTPEGEGISGTRLERAMQLITMAVLKPSLMVIGVIASISVSYVAFAVVNRFFWETAEYVLHGSVLDIVAVVSIYVIIAFQVVRLLVSVMYKLPDQILDWFASGVGRQFGENEVGSMAEKTGNEMKGGAQQVSGGAAKLIGERRRNAMYAKSRNSSSGGGEES